MRAKRSRWLRVVPVCSLPYLMIVGAAVADAGTGGQPFVFHDLDVLGTSLEVQVAAGTKDEAEKAHLAVREEIERLRKIMSTYDAGTELAQVNASNKAVAVSPELVEVLRSYERWQRVSKGAFSGNLGAVVEVWVEAEKAGKLPDKDALAKLAADGQKPLWVIDEAGKTVTRVGSGQINIDSLGKGWIAMRAAMYARGRASAIKGILVNVGGDLVTIGSSKTDKIEPWAVTVADPKQPEENAKPLTELRVTGMSVVTSGGYERFYTIGGKNYSHLIDPRNGQALDTTDLKGVASATVVVHDNAAANALAASLCVLGPELGMPMVKAAGAEALVVMNDGKQVRSDGFAALEVKPSEMTQKTSPTPSGGGTTGSGAGTVVVAAGNAWPKDYGVSFTVNLLAAAKGRPYVAIWIEDANGKYINTLAVWGNERKYLREMTGWWRIGANDANLVKSVSRATRPVGKYSFAWDGTDQSGKPVPQGKYMVYVETAYEKGGHVVSSGTIDCGAGKSTGTVASTRHFDAVPVTFGAKGT